MWHESDAYLDYVEIRRRIERRLASGAGVVMHTGLFLLAVLALIALFGGYRYSPSFFWVNGFMTGWSGVLLLHGLWTYRNGASATHRRLTAVRAELEQRLDAGDTELIGNPRQAFRAQGLLDEDVRMRAGWVPALTFAMLANSVIWGAGLFAEPYYGLVWHVIVLLSILWFPGVYIVNQARRRLRDARLSRILSARPAAAPGVAKHKRSFDAELERFTRLTDDDGELVDIPDDWATYDAGSQRG